MTAMIMDLVRRGVLHFVAPEATTTRSLWMAEGLEQQLEPDPHHPGGLSPAERYLVETVLLEGVPSGRTSMQEFAKRAAADPRVMMGKYLQWQELAEAESEKIAVTDRGSVIARGAAVLVGLLLFPASFLLVGASRSYVPALGVAVGAALLAFSGKIRRRTWRAAHAYDEWQAFRRYLLDFSRLADDPAPAIAVWDEYLVYAVSLGVAHRVLAQFRPLAPTPVDESNTWLTAVPHWTYESGSWTDAFGDAWAVLSSGNSGAKIVRPRR
jgi:hypothetical protein